MRGARGLDEVDVEDGSVGHEREVVRDVLGIGEGGGRGGPVEGAVRGRGGGATAGGDVAGGAGGVLWVQVERELCVHVDHLPGGGLGAGRGRRGRTDPSLARTTEPRRTLSFWWSTTRGCGLRGRERGTRGGGGTRVGASSEWGMSGVRSSGWGGVSGACAGRGH